MNNKNICFFTHAGLKKAGGAERVLTLIANNLCKIGYNVFILTIYSEEDSFYLLNNEVVKLSIFNKSSSDKFAFKKILNLSQGIRKQIENNNIGLIIPLGTESSIYVFFALFLKRSVKKISWIHYSFFKPLNLKERIFRKFILPSFDKIIILNKTDYFKYSELYPGKIIRIPNPVPFHSEKVSNLKNKNILALGRIDKIKGFDSMIKAFKILLEERKIGEWKLNIFGDDNGEQAHITKLISENNLGDHIYIHKAKKNIETEYLKSAFYLMTSLTESFPMVLLESQEYGLPIISYDCNSGPRDIVNNGIDGFLIEEGNLRDLADRMAELMRDLDLRQKMGIQAKKNSKNFDIERVITKWKILIDEL
jgi:glycosyltransferase involved in cell wall biosynthesis